MIQARFRWPLLLACVMPLVLAGCLGSSRSSRFYTLSPVEVRGGATTSGSDATVAVGPVDIPEYLDRPEIVTRTGTNELIMAEFDRWGGPLDKEIGGSLVATLADRLAARNIAVVPWKSAALAPGTTPYRAAISITRFDGVLGQSVVLHGRWELLVERGGKLVPLGSKEATVPEKVDGAGYDALVAAMQRALVRFGQEMAESVAAATEMAQAR